MERDAKLVAGGMTPVDMCKMLRADDVSEVGILRRIRALFGLSLGEAKTALVRSHDAGNSLVEYQATLLPALELAMKLDRTK